MGSAHLEVVQRIADPRCSRIVCRPSKLALHAPTMSQHGSDCTCRPRTPELVAAALQPSQEQAGSGACSRYAALGLCQQMMSGTAYLGSRPMPGA
jgi:hypothetical protein